MKKYYPQVSPPTLTKSGGVVPQSPPLLKIIQNLIFYTDDGRRVGAGNYDTCEALLLETLKYDLYVLTVLTMYNEFTKTFIYCTIHSA